MSSAGEVASGSRSGRLRRGTGAVLRLAVVGLCLAYALWEIDLASLATALAAYDPLRVLLVGLSTALAYLALSLRLACLTRLRGDPTRALRLNLTASLFGFGMNNLLPARLGEIAKVFYLQSRCERDSGWLLGAVFWERFADVHALLVLGAATVLLVGEGRGLAPLAAALGLGWAGVVTVRRHRRTFEGWLGRLGHRPTRAFLGALLGHLAERLGARTALLWLAYGLHVWLVTIWVAELPLAPDEVLVVFLLVTLGMVIPISPGGLGVYEAIFVVVLGWYGVAAEAALATALTAHMLQYIPTTLLAAIILARSDVPLRAIRAARR